MNLLLVERSRRFFLPKKMRLFAELHFCPNVFNKRKGINELLIKQRRSLFTLIWRILDKGEGGDICKPFLACPIIHHLFRVCMRGSVLHTSNRSFWRQQHNTRELFFSKTRFNILHVSVPNVFHHFLMLQEEEEAISLCCCQCCWKDDFFLVYTFEPIRRKWAWWQFCRLYAERASRGYIRYSDGSAAYVIRLHTWTGYISGNHTQRIGMFLSRL